MKEKKKNIEKMDFKAIMPVFIIMLVDVLGLTIIIPLLPLFSAKFGANELTIGFLAAAYPLFQFVFAPILGGLSDRYGRKPVLVISQIGTMLGFVVMIFSQNIWMLFISRIIDGISGANIVTAQAVISDLTNKENKTKAMGLIGAAFGIGILIGPLIAFAMLSISENNFQLVALVAAVVSLISVLLTVFWLEESQKAKQDKTFSNQNLFKKMLIALKTPTVGLFILVLFSVQLIFTGFEQFFPVFTMNKFGLNGAQTAVLFIIFGILIVYFQGVLLGKLSNRLGDKKLISVSIIILAIGLIITSMSPEQPLPGYSKENFLLELEQNPQPNPEGITGESMNIEIPENQPTGWGGIIFFTFAMIPVIFGGGVLQPTINSLISQKVSDDEVGNILGIATSFVSLAMIFAPLLMGFIFQFAGGSTALLLSGTFLIFVWIFSRKKMTTM